MMAYRQTWAWNHPTYINYIYQKDVRNVAESRVCVSRRMIVFRLVQVQVLGMSQKSHIKNEENEETAIRSWWCHGGLPLHLGASYFQTDPLIGN